MRKKKKKKKYHKKQIPIEYRIKDIKDKRLHRREEAYISR